MEWKIIFSIEKKHDETLSRLNKRGRKTRNPLEPIFKDKEIMIIRLQDILLIKVFCNCTKSGNML